MLIIIKQVHVGCAYWPSNILAHEKEQRVANRMYICTRKCHKDKAEQVKQAEAAKKPQAGSGHEKQGAAKSGGKSK